MTLLHLFDKARDGDAAKEPERLAGRVAVLVPDAGRHENHTSTSSGIARGLNSGRATATPLTTGGSSWSPQWKDTGVPERSYASGPLPPSPHPRSTNIRRRKGSSAPSGQRPTAGCRSHRSPLGKAGGKAFRFKVNCFDSLRYYACTRVRMPFTVNRAAKPNTISEQA